MTSIIERLKRGHQGSGIGPLDCYDALQEIERLRAVVRVNGLRWGHTHAEIDELLISGQRNSNG